MGRKGLRRLDLWLPENHWVWSVPEGSRTAVAKKWLELKTPTEALEERLAALEKAVARMEQKLGESPKEAEHKNREPSCEKKPPAIDPEAFFNI